jgi:nucleoid-associated protein YgaU
MFARIALIVLLATFLGWSLMTRTVDGAGRPQVYVVKPGDTLWTIAASRYAGDTREGVWKLQRSNHLAGVTLTPGQKLTVP